MANTGNPANSVILGLSDVFKQLRLAMEKIDILNGKMLDSRILIFWTLVEQQAELDGKLSSVLSILLWSWLGINQLLECDTKWSTYCEYDCWRKLLLKDKLKAPAVISFLALSQSSSDSRSVICQSMAAGLSLTLKDNTVLTALDEPDIKHPAINPAAGVLRATPYTPLQTVIRRSRPRKIASTVLVSHRTSCRFILVPSALLFSARSCSILPHIPIRLTLC